MIASCRIETPSPVPLGEKGHNLQIRSLSPLGERVDRDGAFTSRRGTGEGVVA